jgi:hypothetical protein
MSSTFVGPRGEEVEAFAPGVVKLLPGPPALASDLEEAETLRGAANCLIIRNNQEVLTFKRSASVARDKLCSNADTWGHMS